MKKIYINGKPVSEQRLMEIKPGDTVYVCDDTPVGKPQGAVVIEKEEEGKKTLKERIASLPWWQKAGAIVGAIAGGAYIASRFSPTDTDDDEDEEDNEDNETDEEEE